MPESDDLTDEEKEALKPVEEDKKKDKTYEETIDEVDTQMIEEEIEW